MSFPPRAAAIYAVLTDKEEGSTIPRGADQRDEGTIIDDFQNTNPYGVIVSREKQPSFWSYQHFLTEYPDELIVKVSEYFNGEKNLITIGSVSSYVLELKYPDDATVSYNPGPPDYDSPPDPNGETAIISRSEQTGNIPIYPRWHTEDSLDFSADGLAYDYYSASGIVPTKGAKYYIYPVFGVVYFGFVGSWDIKVDNLLSEVLNVETGDYEYYPYKQATTEFKMTSKYTIPEMWKVCCWNDGTIIRGKVAIYSADVTTGTIPSSGYGFEGMTAEVGDEFSPHSEVDWEVTISDDYDPVEIEIPKVSGKVTFVNDFWITEVVPPGGA